MKPNGQTILEQLEPLSPLDLKACATVSDIVNGMMQCSFGARMLGEVAETLTEWAIENRRVEIICDARPDDQIWNFFARIRKFAPSFHPTYATHFIESGVMAGNGLIVGPIPGYLEQEISRRIERKIFVNSHFQCTPGQVRDGHFPDVVFSDPSLIIPILFHVLRESVRGEYSSVGDLMTSLEICTGVGKEVVHGAHTLTKMLRDPECTVMLTLSGAMTIAKMQLLVADLIETGRVKYVAATGALMAHGLVEGSGCRHYKYDPQFSDESLAAEGLNRVTDTIEPETNFDHIEKIVAEVLDGYDGREDICSSRFHRDLGAYLEKNFPGERAILSAAYRQRVPVVTPAFTDSELANDVFVHNVRRVREGRAPVVFNQERDTAVLFDLATSAKRLGIFTIGGGVPRNNTQNVAPLIEIYNARLGEQQPAGRFFYACRVDPAPMSLGHLSGCTYREGGTWRKFDFDGQFAEVHCDATIAWPFMQKFALEKLERG
ncbi:deoxyhypusine synthase family protein [Candidatus Uhrbacteria bacterium]|nr:deoxyhypusine synthase family protein [Candidatus Uhrbacteria bacterium]